MDKSNVEYLYNGILSSNKKKQTIHTYNKMDEPQKHYVNKVRYIWVHSIWFQNYRDRKLSSGGLWDGSGDGLQMHVRELLGW